MASATPDSKPAGATGRPKLDSARSAARDVVRTITDATDDLDERLGSASGAAEVGVRATSEALRRRSDATLAILGTFSLGLTTGLLVAGAHRLMIVASLVPAALVGGVILERVDGPRRRSARDGADDAPIG